METESKRSKRLWVTREHRTPRELLCPDQLPSRSFLQRAQRRRLLRPLETVAQTPKLPTLFYCSRSDTSPSSSSSSSWSSWLFSFFSISAQLLWHVQGFIRNPVWSNRCIGTVFVTWHRFIASLVIKVIVGLCISRGATTSFYILTYDVSSLTWQSFKGTRCQYPYIWATWKRHVMHVLIYVSIQTM